MRVTTSLPPDVAEKFEQWRRAWPPITPTRSQAARHIITAYLDQWRTMRSRNPKRTNHQETTTQG